MTAERRPGAPAQDRPGAPSWDLFLAGAHGPERTVAYALAAERAGFDGVWLAEHHFLSYGQVPSATVLAGHILGRTQRIAVGTAACVLSVRHPVALGEEAALLDAIAPGRFRLGVARGGPWVELEVFGEACEPDQGHRGEACEPDQGHRGEACEPNQGCSGTGLDRYEHGFPEALDLLLRWLSGAARVGGDGPRFRFREVAVVPRPARPVPIWVAATSTGTADLAAARGLPLLLGVHDDLAAKAAMLARYAEVAAAHGHDPAGVPHGSVHLAYQGDPAQVRPALVSWLATTREYVRLDGAATTRDIEAYVDHLLRIHPPGSLAAVASPLVDLGVRHVLLMVEAAGPAATEAQLTTFAADPDCQMARQ